MNAYFQLESSREKVLADVKKLLASLTDYSSIEEQIAAREAELEEIGTLVRVAIQNNASRANMPAVFSSPPKLMKFCRKQSSGASGMQKQHTVRRLECTFLSHRRQACKRLACVHRIQKQSFLLRHQGNRRITFL